MTPRLHLIKLAVGIRDLGHLREAQARRIRESHEDPPRLRHRTRNRPVRREELLDGGSLYWVIQGVIGARQRILDLEVHSPEDGSGKRCAIVLEPGLVATVPWPRRPFQGWRYLTAQDAPRDLRTSVASELPPEFAARLTALGLLGNPGSAT